MGRPRKKTTEEQGPGVAVQIVARGRYAEVLQALAQGHSVKTIADELGMTPAQVGGIRKSAQMRAERMAANDWQDHIIQKSKEILVAGVESPVGLTPEQYNQNKIAQGNLKGLKVYAVGDGVVTPPPASNTTIYQNVQILLKMTSEEQEQLLEESRRGLLGSPNEGHGAVRRLGAGNEAAVERPAVVVEASD